MDRRTLLAVILAALVMIGYQIFFGQRQAPEGESSAETNVGIESGEAGTEGASVEEWAADRGARESFPGSPNQAFLRPAGAAFPVEIETPLYISRIVPQGATLDRWVLRSYTAADERPAELVNASSLGLIQFRVLHDRGVLDLSDALFETRETTGPAGRRVELVAATEDGVRCEITYTFSEAEYVANLDIRIDGFANSRGDGQLQVVLPQGLPNLERVPKVDETARGAIASLGGKTIKETTAKQKVGWSREESGSVEWIATRSKYFIVALVPATSVAGDVRFDQPEGGTGLRTALHLPLPAAGTAQHSFRLYAGPTELDQLTAIGGGLDRALDLGWTWIRPFSRLLLTILNWFHALIPNYGVAVLLLSIVTKLVFYPLTKKSLESMKQLQGLKPEMDRISEQFKDDPQRKQQAIFDLYKTKKVNPASGCLPMLVQMPVFVALYQVLSNAIELRKEPFLLWIDDLSAPDAIGSLLGFPIHVLPLLMAGTMFIQQKMTPTDPRQAALLYIMPVMMLFFFYTLPSGLVLYWTVSNVLQIGQQAMVNKETRTHQAAA